LPTKTEQSDLLQALHGRNGESSIPIIAPSKPTDCFWVAIEAARIATKYMTPVFILSDSYLGNGAEPWMIPDVSELPEFKVKFHTEVEGFAPYARDPETLSRPWVRPGTPGLEHRIGGLEKEDETGDVSYDPINHEKMVGLRTAKVAGIAKDIPDAEVWGEPEGDLLVVGWGGTYGSLRGAVIEAQLEGVAVSHLHLRYLNPIQANVESVLRSFKKVLVCELNLGQLRQVLRAQYSIECDGLNKVQGKPFTVEEILDSIRAHMGR
jgi:2-oxoglutarate ferredoxin oxidoreductase subunit alpha